MSHPTTGLDRSTWERFRTFVPVICGDLGFPAVKAMASMFLTGEIEPQEQMA
jgi:hypothetical protein